MNFLMCGIRFYREQLVKLNPAYPLILLLFISCGVFDPAEKVLPLGEYEAFFRLHTGDTLCYGNSVDDTGIYLHRWTVLDERLEGENSCYEIRIDNRERTETFEYIDNVIYHTSDGLFNPFLFSVRDEARTRGKLADLTLPVGGTFTYANGTRVFTATVIQKTYDMIVIDYHYVKGTNGFILTFTRGAGITKIGYPSSDEKLYLVKRESNE